MTVLQMLTTTTVSVDRLTYNVSERNQYCLQKPSMQVLDLPNIFLVIYSTI